jgi:HrpA-like RNA helicase
MKSNLKHPNDSFEVESTLSSINTNDELFRKNNNRIIEGLPENRGSVLIFVPGMHNIQALNDLITKEFNNEYLIDVLPLHSEIPVDQQMRVFQKPKPCHRKVIIISSKIIRILILN